MAIIKSCTDIEQSKKLAEILPLKSADMDYIPIANIDGEYSVEVNEWDNEHVIEEGWIPCWSLAALLAIFPDHLYFGSERMQFGIDKMGSLYNAYYEAKHSFWQTRADNPVDACYEMVLKLNEQKLL